MKPNFKNINIHSTPEAEAFRRLIGKRNRALKQIGKPGTNQG